MKRICFVVQRYGLEINGGAELLARQIAERMTGIYDVSVLTTKAVDYVTWKDEYSNDSEIINDVSIHRFSVKKPRVQKKFDVINTKFLRDGLSNEEEYQWLNEQGPYVPGLINYITDNIDDYEVFLFCTYLYYPTVMGVPAAASKAILIPFAHDEPFMNMEMYRDVFMKPRGIIFETEEERKLIRNKFGNYDVPFRYGGAGIEIQEKPEPLRFRKKYGLKPEEQYFIYVGRIEEGKNCGQLFQYFRMFQESHSGKRKLVLLGRAVMDIPEAEDIIAPGFVSDTDKYDGISGAAALVLPSKFESLSMVVLEAMKLGVPVIVNGTSEVLKGHCARSGGGFYYNNYTEFEKEAETLLNDKTRRSIMGNAGRAYIDENYSWDYIIHNICDLIESI